MKLRVGVVTMSRKTSLMARPLSDQVEVSVDVSVVNLQELKDKNRVQVYAPPSSRPCFLL